MYSGVSVTSRRTPGRSRPVSSGRWARSVIRTRHSVWRMSRASSAPRRVGLIPATAAPARAAAPSQSGNSGVLPSSTPRWGSAAGGRRSVRSAARAAAPAATSWCVRLRSSYRRPGRWSPHRAAMSSATVLALESMGRHGS
ncbi:hypothetical protein ADK65_11805 [Streptomyces sp. NRRL B-1140]|nr:hypothetical protein ADK65_11805 [Streptomyces sp. NRRL B-1140]